MNRTMPCLQMNKLYILGSWSQCIRKSERGLSVNRPTPAPSEEGSRHWSAPCQFPSWEGSGVGSWSQCIRKSERGLSMNRNSQTRMTNDQIRRNDQTRMDETGDCTTQRIWTFELRISFVIRHSTTYTNRVHGPNAFEKTKGGSP